VALAGVAGARAARGEGRDVAPSDLGDGVDDPIARRAVELLTATRTIGAGVARTDAEGRADGR
jgi:hypothetical protein